MSIIVTYIRVSTKQQEVSGLGLEAQRALVEQYRANTGSSILAEYEEIESGRKSDRPQLAKALEHARSAGATLVIAKLDRLARNVAFTATLLDAGVDFVCCDMPNATRFTIHIYAAIAEEEARMIRERTKAALAVRKTQGKKLGAQNPAIFAALEGKRGYKKGSPTVARLQRERYGAMLPVIRALHDRGETTGGIAAALNAQGYRTARGLAFTAALVKRILQREAELVAVVEVL